jgi:hypothetical protein
VHVVPKFSKPDKPTAAKMKLLVVKSASLSLSLVVDKVDAIST